MDMEGEDSVSWMDMDGKCMDMDGFCFGAACFDLFVVHTLAILLVDFGYNGVFMHFFGLHM